MNNKTKPEVGAAVPSGPSPETKTAPESAEVKQAREANDRRQSFSDAARFFRDAQNSCEQIAYYCEHSPANETMIKEAHQLLLARLEKAQAALKASGALTP